MFRSRFTEAFPKSLPHYGPQDIENGVATNVPGEHVERLLCALLGLVLNRKKDIEYVDIESSALFLGLRATGTDTFNQTSRANSEIGGITILAPWKKLFRHIRANGRENGRGKIRFMEEAASTQCPQNNEYVSVGSP